MLQKCDCGKLAVWIYEPGFSNGSPFFCDDCVPRGCTCNHYYVDVNSYHPPLENPNSPEESDHPIKWIEIDKIWCRVDEKGREYPCCEYGYDQNGFDFENNLD